MATSRCKVLSAAALIVFIALFWFASSSVDPVAPEVTDAKFVASSANPSVSKGTSGASAQTVSDPTASPMVESVALPKENKANGASCEKDDEVTWQPSDFVGTTSSEREQFCRRYGHEPREKPVRIIYGVMFNFELDMLEVLLHEVYPVVDAFFIVESTITHSTKQKEPVWPAAAAKEARWKPFVAPANGGGGSDPSSSNKVHHLVWGPKKVIRQGWDVEKGQRIRFIEELITMTSFRGIPPSTGPPAVAQGLQLNSSDLIFANLDLDEIPSRFVLLQFKYCDVPKVFLRIFHFRYHLGCLQTLKVDDLFNTVFFWPQHDPHAAKAIKKEIYKRREHRQRNEIKAENIEMELQRGFVTWHMSAFGGVNAIMKKNEHSPHRFVGDFSKAAVEEEMRKCLFKGERMNQVEVHEEMSLPFFIARNRCYFERQGWFGPALQSKAIAKGPGPG